jgi:hypothetical protein
VENYGRRVPPGEFLQYGGQWDEVSGEFWSGADLGDIGAWERCRAKI